MRCAVCGESSTFACSSCHNVFYCNKSHQKQDWKTGHKAKCTPYRIVWNAVLGRHMIATRAIQPGETIFTESPLIYGPKMASPPICLGCHKLLLPPQSPATNYYKCRRCGWPLCSADCESSTHHLQECQLMSSKNYCSRIDYQRKKSATTNGSACFEAAYCVVLPLRCMLMRATNPEAYARLLELQDHLEARIKTPLYSVLRANLVTFVQTILGMGGEWNEMEILRVAAILDTNAFELRADGAKLRCIYPTAAMISHDCVPNARHTFGADRQIIFFAKFKIQKGEVISTSYTQPLKCTLSRRSHLWQAKCFLCGCGRCMDFTELGTFSGSILCNQCKVGKIVSLDTADFQSSWQCQLCPHQLKVQNIMAGNDAIQNEIAALDKSSPEALEDFLQRHVELLHEKNSFALEVKYALTQLYGRVPGFMLDELNEAALKRKVSLCEELLEIADIFDPGWSIFRGLLLHDLYESKVALIKFQTECGVLTNFAAQEKLLYLAPYKKEVDKITKVDPEFKHMLDQLPKQAPLSHAEMPGQRQVEEYDEYEDEEELQLELETLKQRPF